MKSGGDRRSDVRHQRDERVLVKILNSDDDPSLAGTILRCATQDVSLEGVRVRLPQPLPVGCELDLWVKMHDRAGPVSATGRVVWVHEQEEPEAGGFRVGIRVGARSGREREAWRSAIRALAGDSAPEG